jgi:hypothetical protein
MKNFVFGISVIRRWLDDGRLDISPDSIAAKQLESITDIDLQGSPEIKYPAINGLRYAIAAFHKFRPNYEPPFRPKRRNRGGVIGRPSGEWRKMNHRDKIKGEA